jgi:hypothetical protein
MLWNVSNTTNNGGLIEVTTSTSNTLVTGNFVEIEGVLGTIEANGNWVITVIDTSHFTLNGSAFVHIHSASPGIVYYAQNWNGELLIQQLTNVSGVNSPPTGSPLRPVINNISGLQAAPLAELMMPNTGAVKYFQMRGWYISGETYETWVVANVPSSIPPSGHILIDVEIAATWTQ